MALWTKEDFKEVSVVVTGLVRSFDPDDGELKYDWWVSDNDESDELFVSAEEAERDFMQHFGS